MWGWSCVVGDGLGVGLCRDTTKVKYNNELHLQERKASKEDIFTHLWIQLILCLFPNGAIFIIDFVLQSIVCYCLFFFLCLNK